MDLRELKPRDEAELELVHPTTGTELGVYITVYGMDSAAFDNAKRRVVDRRFEMNRRRGRPKRQTAEDIEKDRLEILALITCSWRTRNGDGTFVPTITFEDRELECTLENARLLYDSLAWVREQVDAFTADRAAFMTT